jgi:tRNA pseudouridine13 synthase
VDAVVEQPRCAAFEISPTGPLYGPRMTEPEGHPAQSELQVLVDSGLTRPLLQGGHPNQAPGGRRPLRVPLKEVDLHAGTDQRGPFLALLFFLPAGAYATNVMREVCKYDESNGDTSDE